MSTWAARSATCELTYQTRSGRFLTRLRQTYDLATQFSNVYGTIIGANEISATDSLGPLDMEHQLHKISVPTLASQSGFDKASDEGVRARCNLILDVEYQKIPVISHTPHLEKAHLIIPIIADFLARHDSPL